MSGNSSRAAVCRIILGGARDTQNHTRQSEARSRAIELCQTLLRDTGLLTNPHYGLSLLVAAPKYRCACRTRIRPPVRSLRRARPLLHTAAARRKLFRGKGQQTSSKIIPPTLLGFLRRGSDIGPPSRQAFRPSLSHWQPPRQRGLSRQTSGGFRPWLAIRHGQSLSDED